MQRNAELKKKLSQTEEIDLIDDGEYWWRRSSRHLAFTGEEQFFSGFRCQDRRRTCCSSARVWSGLHPLWPSWRGTPTLYAAHLPQSKHQLSINDPPLAIISFSALISNISLCYLLPIHFFLVHLQTKGRTYDVPIPNSLGGPCPRALTRCH